MAAIYAAVQAAFDQRLGGFADARGHDVAWPNTRYRPLRDALWLRPRLEPRRSRLATLGTGGFDRVSGDYRIEIVAPAGGGTAAAATVADGLLAEFSRGLQLAEGAVTVDVVDSRRAPARQERRGLVMPVVVRWTTLSS